MKHIFNFNELLYTEESVKKLESANRQMWIALADLELFYKKELTVIHSLSNADSASTVVELKFLSDSPELQDKACNLYQLHYQRYPIYRV